MKSLHAILFLSLTITALGQQNNGFTNKAEAKNLTVNGLKEGKWVEYIDSSFKISTDTTSPYFMLTIYKAGMRSGTVRKYYKTGPLMEETPFTASGEYVYGSYSQYYENGQVKWIEPYFDSTLNGIVKEYYVNGVIEQEIPYLKGKKNGVAKLYYENGVVNQEDPYTNGLEEGTAKSYYFSGKLFWERQYSKNKINGTEKTYYESGTIEKVTIYSNDSLVSSKSYDMDGKEMK